MPDRIVLDGDHKWRKSDGLRLSRNKTMGPVTKRMCRPIGIRRNDDVEKIDAINRDSCKLRDVALTLSAEERAKSTAQSARVESSA